MEVALEVALEEVKGEELASGLAPESAAAQDLTVEILAVALPLPQLSTSTTTSTFRKFL